MPPPQLAVRNIPPHVNNIAHLNNHFARDQLYKDRSSRNIRDGEVTFEKELSYSSSYFQMRNLGT